MLALLITHNSPRLFTASADVLLKPTAESITPGSDSTEDRPRGPDQIETEVQYIQSRDMAGKVFDQLDLGNDPVFRAQLHGGGRVSGSMSHASLNTSPSRVESLNDDSSNFWAEARTRRFNACVCNWRWTCWPRRMCRCHRSRHGQAFRATGDF